MVEHAFDELELTVSVEHLREGQFDFELAQCDEVREPAMQVTVRFLDEWHHAELYAPPDGGPDVQSRIPADADSSVACS